MTGLLVPPTVRFSRPPGLTPCAFAALENFERQACRELLSEGDWTRFFEMIETACSDSSCCCAKDLHRWFVDTRGWPDEVAGDLCHFYERGSALLKHAGIS